MQKDGLIFPGVRGLLALVNRIVTRVVPRTFVGL